MLEKMADFFTARLDEYEEHMLNNAQGCREGYIELARLLPSAAQNILDLGCGTGLELAEIFRRFPNAEVTGIDLAQALLDRLRIKYGERNIRLICASYLDYAFEPGAYDAAVSFETMHHLTFEQKAGLYLNINTALNPSGVYIECDYMVTEEAEERRYLEENRRIRAEQGIGEHEMYHYDIPCTVNRQISLLAGAGFRRANQVWRVGCTTIIIAEK